MRFYALFGALVCLFQIPMGAQNTMSTTGQSLQGTWISSIALPGGDFVPFAIDIFHADGSYIGANMDPTH